MNSCLTRVGELHNEGCNLRDRGDYKAALPIFYEELKTLLSLIDEPSYADVADTHCNIGQVTGDRGEASIHYYQAYMIRCAVFGKENALTLHTWKLFQIV
mmetsp:Transcript_12299/g.14480  ORF Transcript_12299/g.14480 Transcript_12299/m.14480 type:complete len:100 (-) Transcript_12299:130-429(-)